MSLALEALAFRWEWEMNMIKGWSVALLALMGMTAPVSAQYLVPSQTTAPPPEPLPYAPASVTPAPLFPPAGNSGDMFPSPNSLPLDSPNASADIEIDDSHRYFLSVEYLQWWLKEDRGNNALITSSRNPTTNALPGDPGSGALGDPDTVILLGERGLSHGMLPGVRFSAGIAPDWFLPFEVGGFWVHSSSGDLVDSDSGGSPLIARSAFARFVSSPTTINETQLIVAFPGQLRGGIKRTFLTDFGSAEANVFLRPFEAMEFEAFAIDFFVGGRYMVLREDLNFQSSSAPLDPTVTIPFGGTGYFGMENVLVVRDSFQTRNTFRGGQIGARSSLALGMFNLHVKGNLAVGWMNQQVNIRGVTTLFQDGNVFGSLPGGWQALPSNSGRFTDDRLAFVPELAVNLEMPISESFRLYVGYNLLYWYHVVRPGNQIFRTVDMEQVPSSYYDPTVTANRPPFLFRRTDFWAQGVNIGLVFTY